MCHDVSNIAGVCVCGGGGGVPYWVRGGDVVYARSYTSWCILTRKYFPLDPCPHN
jgi:hypothetical protein